METEIEVKFVAANHEKVRRRLTELGAKMVKPMRLMKRVTIDTADMKSKDAFVRIRDEGDKITVTYKQFDELSLHGAQEIEVEVSDFDKTIALFKAAGLPYGSFQESKRETWQLDQVVIELDEWPWLKPYIEIEGPDEKSVKETASRLDYDWKDAVFGDVMAAYRVQYPHLGENDTVGGLAEVKFNQPVPDIFKKR